MAKLTTDKVARSIKRRTGVSDAKAKKAARRFMKNRKNKKRRR